MTLIAGVIGMFLAAAWVWRSPTTSLMTMPDRPDEAFDGGEATQERDVSYCTGPIHDRSLRDAAFGKARLG